MAYKIIVMDEFSNEEDGYKNLTLLTGSVKDEVICAEFHSNMDENPDVIELAVNLADMYKMQEFLNNIISKVEKGYCEV